ncbi:MAG: MFS transporter [Oscillospiraceae bacterium]|jgi:Na+/melibiose symporter-like transporter|nr:MFS transporter [Oscillospiraceae bacterium]
MKKQTDFIKDLAFAAPGFATSLLSTMSATFLLYFYTDVLIIPVGIASVLILTLRVFDGAIDPALSYAMDRRTTRFGKYKGYLVFCAAPVCLFFALIFTPSPFSGTRGNVIWQAVCVGLWSLFFSIAECAYLPMLATSSREKNEMKRRNAVKLVLSIVAALLVRFYALKLADIFGGGSERQGFFRLAVIIAAAALITFAPILFIKERAIESEKRLTLRQLGKILVKDRILLYILLFYALHQMASAVKNQSAIYYMKYYVGRVDLTPIFLVVNVISSLAMQPVIYFAAKRVRPVRLIAGGYAGAAVSMLIMGLGGRFLPLLIAGNALCGIATAFPSNLVFYHVAEVSLELSQSNKSSIYATSSSMLSLASRFGIAAGPAFVSGALWFTGYTPNASQCVASLTGIQVCFVLVSMILYGTAAFFAIKSGRRKILEHNKRNNFRRGA